MRKAERLFQIITLLRGRRTVITAEQLAERLAVSERTIYRDMQSLCLSGMPIESEAGVGYRLKPKYDIPPLMFDEQELEALLLGAQMVQSWAGAKMGEGATTAMNKIHSVIPEELRDQLVTRPEWVKVPAFNKELLTRFSDELQLSIKQQQKVKMDYSKEDGESSTRVVAPLGLVFWGRVWTLVAWCDLRDDYRMFRLDRIQGLVIQQERFELTDTFSLQHYWQSCSEE